MSTIKNTILSVTRRTARGFTVGEIYDRLATRALSTSTLPPPYNSVRARVYELAKAGSLCVWDFRNDPVSGRVSATFVRNN